MLRRALLMRLDLRAGPVGHAQPARSRLRSRPPSRASGAPIGGPSTTLLDPDPRRRGCPPEPPKAISRPRKSRLIYMVQKSNGSPRSGSVRRLALGRDELAVDEAFGDLNGVERRALAQIVRHTPQREAVLHRRVLAD